MLFIRDTLRFISAFIVPISKSAPQIYLSVLPFAPKHSLIAENFGPRFPNTLTISDGRPLQWPMIVFVAEHDKDDVGCIVLSPDERIFASISAQYKQYEKPSTMYICDSETGHCILGPFQLINLDSPWAHKNACFSPDGKYVLVRYRPHNALVCHTVVWDIERGEEVFQIQGFDFVFIHCGHNEGRIASMDWIDEDEPVSQTVALTDLEDENKFLTRLKEPTSNSYPGQVVGCWE